MYLDRMQIRRISIREKEEPMRKGGEVLDG